MLPPPADEEREASGLRAKVAQDEPSDDVEEWLDSAWLEELGEPHDTEPAPPPTLRSAAR